MSPHITGSAPVAAANEHNESIVGCVIDWVAAHPNHAGFRTLRMPPPVPILAIIESESQMGQWANRSKDYNPINRLRADDVNLEPLRTDAEWTFGSIVEPVTRALESCHTSRKPCFGTFGH